MTISVINLEHAIINENELRIIGSSTSFAGDKRSDIPTVKSVQEKLKAVIKLARSNGTKLKNQKATKDKLAKLESSVPALTQTYNELFDKAVIFWKSKVDLESKTIPNYSPEAMKEGYELRNQMWAMFHRSQPLSQLLEIHNRLDEIEQTITRSENPENITFSL
ncbi:hypothetical protein DZF79_28990 [Vibrio parahaemolyticus]|nr:hypothetical protein [Vibrio parahaemolyticus]